MRRLFVFLSLTTFALALIPMLVSCTHEYKENEIIIDAVTDVDGNSYDAVKLGDQVWMRTNLRTTHFCDGSEIPQGGREDDGSAFPFYYRPTVNDLHNYDGINYGLYYNWLSVADSRGLCPDGWHVPSDVEWTKMENYVRSKSGYVYGINSQNIAKALASEVGWESNEVLGAPGCYPKGNNATGFSAVPAGFYDGEYGHSYFDDEGRCAIFWTSTDFDRLGNTYAYHRYIDYETTFVGRVEGDKENGLSVRCVRD